MDCFNYKSDNFLGTNWTLDTLNIDLSSLTFRDKAIEGSLLTHQALNIFIKAVPSEKLFGIANSLLEKSCAFVADDPTAIVKGHLANEPWFIEVFTFYKIMSTAYITFWQPYFFDNHILSHGTYKLLCKLFFLQMMNQIC